MILLLLFPLYAFGTFVMFLGIALVCHNYFIIALQAFNARVKVCLLFFYEFIYLF